MHLEFSNCVVDSLPEVCSDKHDAKACLEWAKIGECSKNPDWMNNNCKKSCNLCKSELIPFDSMHLPSHFEEVP